MSKIIQLKNPVRVVTATALFDGHDASINLIRRILQDGGAEIIHLGHNRSVKEVVETALQEGAQGICMSSYQGGHMEYFKYMKDFLDEAESPWVRIFGGGGGVILPQEKRELESYGIAQIFHPRDVRKIGLEGMRDFILKACDFDINEMYEKHKSKKIKKQNFPHRDLGLLCSSLENKKEEKTFIDLLSSFKGKKTSPPVLGITGTGGAGKSSLVDELLCRFLNLYPGIRIGVVCVDPSKKKTGGALLGDRIRMNSLKREGIFMRSVASRDSGNEIARSLPVILDELRKLDFDLLIAESSGIGQGGLAITEVSDKSLYVMTSEFGAQTQLEKIEMIDQGDFIVINKSDHRGADDAFRSVKKQYKRSKKLFSEDDKNLPVFLTQASTFNDPGVNELFLAMAQKLSEEYSYFVLNDEKKSLISKGVKEHIIPAERQNYLAEVVDSVRTYKKSVLDTSEKFSRFGALEKIIKSEENSNNPEFLKNLNLKAQELREQIQDEDFKLLKSYEDKRSEYEKDTLTYESRKKISQPLFLESLSGSRIPRVCYPQLSDWGDRFRFLKLENVPGEFPFTAGVFHLKRLDELPGRQFAGEGLAEKTNKRFHYLSQNEKAKRLSTAFDSVTLYGEDPHIRPDIFGKVGESGVSIATLDDMKTLYQGFDLCDPYTSVSMTINGPAPIILAFFMNAAFLQQIEKKEKELKRKLSESEIKEVQDFTLNQVRGTVQADILKEDQGQNTCIFSIDFSLKMMADIQEYFIKKSVKNFYSVSISGYHIAEAGANPITQLALTLSNAFTYVEYYLNRNMKIDDFAQNLSFFFSNGLDPEYTVLGRVARRIWSVSMREKYKAGTRAQKLKYHIQTSGRSLHDQDIEFNDIRTTLQALTALSDHCNSLHTNAYDEAITTPTEESVRRAQAIQLIINKEFGYAKNENPLQGSYFVEYLTDLVEEAVLDEFLRINQRGGVLGAMETQYQRSQIQEESLYYESLKHDGRYPVVGVNTFVDEKVLDENYEPETIELARSSEKEKSFQLERVIKYKESRTQESKKIIEGLKKSILRGENIFEALMLASPHLSLYQMSQALFEVGGEYRRNL